MTESQPITLMPEDLQEGSVVDSRPVRHYKILFLEDNPDDVELMRHELNEAKLNYTSKATDKKSEFLPLVRDFEPDVILADYSLTSLTGMRAFKMLRAEGLIIPFILVTGTLSEVLAVECLKVGIDDFVLKASFKRLSSSIVNAVEKKEVEREKNRMAAELAKSHEELRQLLSRHNSSLEEERIRIARDLHDELGQVLTLLKIEISMLCKKIVDDKLSNVGIVTSEFQSMSARVDQIAQSVKRISAGLRPETLDSLGIVESIRSQAADFEKNMKITCKTFLPSEPLNISRRLSIAMYRIVQETLTNVSRHAKASMVEIHVIPTGSLLLMEVRDNGKGISRSELQNSKSLGLIGLRERVNSLQGRLNINGGSDGTIVTVLLPIKSDNDKGIAS